MTSKVNRRRSYDSSLRKEQAQMTRERILQAARRLLPDGSYSRVTMEEIAREAGVAHQTLYAIFRTKLKLAQAMVDAGFPHVPEALKLAEAVRTSRDPEAWLRTMATLHRRIFEPCADLERFLRESGDPDLLARYHANEQSRYARLNEMVPVLKRSRRLRRGLSPSEAVGIAWTMLGPDYYSHLVLDQGWSPDRYEAWVSEALVELILVHG